MVFDLLERRRGTGEAVLFARSATAGGQQYPVHWGGDCDSTYASMAETLRGGLSLAASGFGYWSHDIGGFEGTPDSGVFKRWLAFGLLSSHSRLHGSGSYRVPWAFDDEAVHVARKFTRLKLSLMPYLAVTARQVQESGTPMLRPMALEFPHDPATGHVDTQYMLGDSLLVAPVFSGDRRVRFLRPGGQLDEPAGRQHGQRPQVGRADPRVRLGAAPGPPRCGHPDRRAGGPAGLRLRRWRHPGPVRPRRADLAVSAGAGPRRRPRLDLRDRSGGRDGHHPAHVGCRSALVRAAAGRCAGDRLRRRRGRRDIGWDRFHAARRFRQRQHYADVPAPRPRTRPPPSRTPPSRTPPSRTPPSRTPPSRHHHLPATQEDFHR
jgi:hypothetical protein